VREVDDAVGLRGRRLEPIEVGNIPATRLGAERGHRSRGLLRPAKPVTSWPAAMSSGMTYEPIWPVPPVTKTCMLLILVGDVMRKAVLRARSAEKADAE